MGVEQDTVLVVDDDPSIGDALKRFLSREGFSTTCANDGTQALEILQQGTLPSVLLVDLVMPMMGGWELIERLKRDHSLSRIPVVVMSAYPRVVAPAKLRHMNLPVVGKPFQMHDMLDTIRSVAKMSCSRWEIPRS
jgi:CheY-like chemotaxis protein